MRTIQEALNYGDKELSREGIMNHLLEIRILLRDSLEITEEKMITDTKVTISEEQFHKYKRFSCKSFGFSNNCRKITRELLH